MGVFLLVVHPLYTNLDEQTYPVFYMYVQICFVLIRNKILSDQKVFVFYVIIVAVYQPQL